VSVAPLPPADGLIAPEIVKEPGTVICALFLLVTPPQPHVRANAKSSVAQTGQLSPEHPLRLNARAPAFTDTMFICESLRRLCAPNTLEGSGSFRTLFQRLV